MEIRRSIELSVLKKIMSEYKEEHREEIESFNRIIRELEKNLEIGEKLIEARYQFFCKDKIKRIKENFNFNFKFANLENSSQIIYQLEEILKNTSPNYSFKNYLIDDLKRCKKFSKSQFEEVFLNAKSQIDTIKQKEKELAKKCFVFEFDEKEIKSCLYSEFLLFRKEVFNNTKDFYKDLSSFQKNIFI